MNKEEAYQLSVLIETGFIDYQSYYKWCDQMIEALEEPPYWVIELSVEKNQDKAVRIIRKYVFQNLFKILKR
ncbi:hypothetical protein [Isobaculum melis]|uniref:Uncharacterized protein n=1 Tax=Isobaculum melis TaxID=142588 RepID=A0A1H9TTZ3_9LACT|nr:hypothetical protein [Isobaculum melis]SES00685.1 hypothetical protein SAMN04488559_11646 [Isobaculum melis]